MKKYYQLDPDEGSYFVYISDLSKKQKYYILTNIYPYDDDISEDDEEYKYQIDAPCCNSDIFNNLIEFLKKEGFKEVDL